MKRLAIYAHYDSQNQVKRFASFFLRCLAEHCQRVDFVTTSNLPASERNRLDGICERVLQSENVGFDFGMWKRALEGIDLSAWDELVLTNSSILGPMFPLGEMFEQMRTRDCAFWGATDNCDIDWHLQSYFFVFRRPVLHSEHFARFWSSVLLYHNKFQVIRSYEVGLTQYLMQHGFRAEAYIPVATLFPPWPLNLRHPRRRHDATIFNPLKLIARRMPFVKASLLRDNPGKVDLTRVYRQLERAGYDLSMIELDPRGNGGRLDRLLEKVRRRP